MKKAKRKEGKKRLGPTTPPEKKQPENPRHKQDFEQLLDDSIFGVKKK